MPTYSRILSSILAAPLLICSTARTQEMPQSPVKPIGLPRYPDNPISNIPAPEKAKLGNDASGVVEPILVPDSTPKLYPNCTGTKDSGSVTLSFIIDANGNPRNVIFKRALANQIDILALHILLESQFKPAMLNGSPVAFGRDVEMHLEVCIMQQPGSTDEITRLRTAPHEKFSNWRHAPAEANLAPIHMPSDAIADAEHLGANFNAPKAIAHKMFDTKGTPGSFSFGTLVDEHGIGHIDKVLRSTNSALLPAAEAMILSIRHIPAMKDGMPVPVHIVESLDFSSRD